MGYCLVVYDISHDRTRTKVADICLDYGLDRIQYSAFIGKLMRTHQEELMIKAKRQLGKRAGSIHLYPICEKDWQQRQRIDVKGPPPGQDEEQATHGRQDKQTDDPEELPPF